VVERAGGHEGEKLGLEGIVSKRKDSAYRFGRSPDWLKMKNPEASAVKRESRGRMGQKETAVTATVYVARWARLGF
jgi:ATP-dependent DNA ligase